MKKIPKARRLNPYFNDVRCVNLQIDITWNQYDLLKKALIDYSKTFSSRDMLELIDLVRG